MLGAIVGDRVLVAAFAYGPIGQFGKPAKPAQQPGSRLPPRPAARAGDPGSAELDKTNACGGSPCGLLPTIPILLITATLTLNSSGAGTTTE